MRYCTVGFILATLVGCQSNQKSAHIPAQPPVLSDAAVLSARVQAEKASNFAVRTTTEDDLTLTVKVPREVTLGAPVPVKVTFANHGTHPVLLYYSTRIRAIWPVVYLNFSGPAPLTPAGERALAHRGDETAVLGGTINPADEWKFDFNAAEYYQLSAPHMYSLGISLCITRVDPITGERTERRFDVSKIAFQVRPAK